MQIYLLIGIIISIISYLIFNNYFKKNTQDNITYLITVDKAENFIIHTSDCKKINLFNNSFLTDPFDTYREVWEFVDIFESKNSDCIYCNPRSLAAV